jgi:hypothetical protein
VRGVCDAQVDLTLRARLVLSLPQAGLSSSETVGCWTPPRGVAQCNALEYIYIHVIYVYVCICMYVCISEVQIVDLARADHRLAASCASCAAGSVYSNCPRGGDT